MDVSPAPKRARSAPEAKSKVESEIGALVSERDRRRYKREWQPDKVLFFVHYVEGWIEGGKFPAGAFASVIEAGRVVEAFHSLMYARICTKSGLLEEKDAEYLRDGTKVLEAAGLREALYGLGVEEVRAYERLDDARYNDLKDEEEEGYEPRNAMKNLDACVAGWIGEIGKGRELAALVEAVDLACAFNSRMMT